MIYISHRGNINGRNPSLENSKDYIVNAISKGYEVEIDVWCENGELYLGHDFPEYSVDIDFIEKYKRFLWIHAKNVEAFVYFSNTNYNYFCHTDEDYVFTSHKYIWCYPNNPIVKNSIMVLPEICEYKSIDFYNALGICSDNIEFYDIRRSQ